MNISAEILKWPPLPPKRNGAMEVVQCALADNSQLMRRYKAQLETCRAYMRESVNACMEPHCPDCNEVEKLLEALED